MGEQGQVNPISWLLPWCWNCPRRSRPFWWSGRLSLPFGTQCLLRLSLPYPECRCCPMWKYQRQNPCNGVPKWLQNHIQRSRWWRQATIHIRHRPSVGEEASEITKVLFNQLELRLRGGADKKIFYLSFNPISAMHGLKEEFFDNPKENSFICHRAYLDNRFLDKE